MSLPQVLFVDDEPNVLVGVSRSLRSRFDIVTALSGEEGLQVLSNQPIDVVVSDMRMPLMDGAAFLARARTLKPEVVRLVMSGQADLDACIRAINDGNIFRFLIKPVGREVLGDVVASAVEQRRLVLAERELLERTLTGAVDALSEGLAMTSPLAFGRSRRLRQVAASISDELRLPKRWALEVAAMLSQLGAATLPPETLRRWYSGEQLSELERSMVARVNSLSCQLVRHLPRLEEVLELMTALESPDNPPSAMSLPVRVIIVADALERRLFQGESLDEALTNLAASPQYDPVVLAACRTLGGILNNGAEGTERAVAVTGVQPGMVLIEDVFSKSGSLLISRGHTVSDGLMTCLRNFAATVGVREPLRVFVSHQAAG